MPKKTLFLQDRGDGRMSAQELSQAVDIARDAPPAPQKNIFKTGSGGIIAPGIPSTGGGSVTPAPPTPKGASGTEGFTRLSVVNGVVTVISGPNVTQITASYTVLPTDDVIEADATSGAITVTLPVASSSLGILLSIIKKDSGGNAVTVSAGSSTINGSGTLALSSQYSEVMIYCDGTAWYVWSSSPAISTIVGPSPITWAASNGGRTYTGTWVANQGDLFYASAANTLSALAKNTTATRYLGNTGTSNNPAWVQVDLVTGVTNTLTVPNGGTGAITLTAHGVLLGEGASAIVATTAGTSGQVLIGQAAADPTFNTISGDATLSSAGALTVKGITETSGPTDLVAGTITDGQFLKRVGGTLVSAAVTSGINPTGYISGCVLSWSTTTAVIVGTGDAYNPNSSTLQTVTNAITSTYSFGSQTDLTIDASNNKKVSSVAHSFTANDVGSTISVTAGTGWTVSTYIILTVDGSGNAFLNKSPSAAGNANKGTYTLKLTASVIYGVFLASTSTVVIQGPAQFVDLAIDASNNKLVSSAAFTFTAAHVGQYINVTAGTSWTTGFYLISSVSAGKATLATSPSAAGNANLATASMSMIPYGGSVGNYQGKASQSIDGNTYRYLGSFLTDASNLITNFLRANNLVRYRANINVAPFKVLAAGAAVSSTSQACSGIVPPTSIEAVASAFAGAGASINFVYFGSSDGTTPTATSGDAFVVCAPSSNLGAGGLVNLNLNPTQAFLYCNTNAASSSVTVMISGYLEDR